MPIQQLPSKAKHLIGSSHAVADPISAVKELVDNALDAQARSIFIEISADTIETIRVRDDGRGIAPEDRSMLCKHHCTSKIRKYSDIKDIGGRSLGFRGEALACAAELSRTVNVTTRVEGEEVAVSMTFNSNGEVEKSQCSSHAIGTTVRLTDIFHQLPVRKQAVLKTANKSHESLKELLEAYAFARSTVKYSLKFLKSRTATIPWIYVPKLNASVFDTACKIVGTDTAKECEYVELETVGYCVQAFLSKKDATASRINNKNNFISVDSRPVSSSRGVFRQILGMVRERVKDQLSNDIRCPFFWMNIICPLQSYDSSVEPSKNDLIFEDTEKVLVAVRSLLDLFYGQPQESTTFNLNGQEMRPNVVNEAVSSDIASLRPSKRRKMWLSNMYDTEELCGHPSFSPPESSSTPPEVEENETLSGLRDPSVSNPWVLAKMHASSRKNLGRGTITEISSLPPNLQASPKQNTWRQDQLLPIPLGSNIETPPTFSTPLEQPQGYDAEAEAPPITSIKHSISMTPARITINENASANLKGRDVVFDDLSQLRPRRMLLPAENCNDPIRRSIGPNLRFPGDSIRHLPIVNRLEGSGSMISSHVSKGKPRDRSAKQHQFVSPVTENTRNWFSNLPQHSSPTKSGLGESMGRYEGMDIRKAFCNGRKAKRAQACRSAETEFECIRAHETNPQGGQAPQDHEAIERVLPEPSPAPQETASVLLPLEQTPQGHEMQEVILTLRASVHGLSYLSMRRAELVLRMFGHGGRALYEPLCRESTCSIVRDPSCRAIAMPINKAGGFNLSRDDGTQAPLPSFFYPPVDQSDIERWTSRLFNYLGRKSGKSNSGDEFNWWKEHIDIAHALATLVA